jgi:serine/threonine protein kinase
MQLREIKALRKLTHPNIIKLKEVLKVSDELNLVFEFLEKNVFEVYMDYKNKGERIPEQTIKSIIRQVVEGLAYMHKHGYFHRYRINTLNLGILNLRIFSCTAKLLRSATSA